MGCMHPCNADNNFPFSMARAIGSADDNELVALHVPGFFSGGAGCTPAAA